MNNFDRILKEWLLGMVIASFSFSAGFSIRLERKVLSSEYPNVLYLDIKSLSRIGNKVDWDRLVKSMPFEARGIEPSEPAFAYMLMLLLGSEIVSLDIGNEALAMDTTYGKKLYIECVDDVWDESWVLGDRTDLVGENTRAIICKADGTFLAT
jgi:hypothetical protein